MTRRDTQAPPGADAFLFSIVVSIGAQEADLRSTLSSLRRQGVPFGRIQVLLVPRDGKPQTRALGEAWAAQYSANVRFLCPEQPGYYAGKNAGFESAQGRYVGQMDVGDCLAPGTLRGVLGVRQSPDAPALVQVPFLYAERPGRAKVRRRSGAEEAQWVDVRQDPGAVLTTCRFCFFPLQVARQVRFDAGLTSDVELQNALLLLLEHPRYAVAPGCYVASRENVRLRKALRGNALSAYLQEVVLPVQQSFRERTGGVPAFVYHGWLKNLPTHRGQKKPSAVLGELPSLEALNALLGQALKEAPDAAVLGQDKLSEAEKAFLLRLKYGEPGTPASKQGETLLCFGQTQALSLGSLPVVLHFFNFLEEGIEIDASVYFLPDLWAGGEPLLFVDGAPQEAAPYDREQAWHSFAQPTLVAKSFRFVLPYSRVRDGLRLSFYAREGQGNPQRRAHLITGPFVPFTGHMRYGYLVRGGMKYALRDGEICVKRCGPLGHVVAEGLAQLNLLRQSRRLAPGLTRLLAKVLRPFLRRRIWLMLDRPGKGEDNGEALFRYVMGQKDSGKRVYFVLSKRSEAYRSLRSDFSNVLPYRGFRHRLCLLLGCDVISSHITHTADLIFGRQVYFYADLLYNTHYLYLKHGVIQDDTSRVLGRYQKNLSLFLTATTQEHRAILRYPYGYGEEVVQLTGLPRYDRLYHDEQRRILIAPTWRKYLMRKADEALHLWEHTGGDNPYFSFYRKLLNHPGLLDEAARLGYTVCLKPHPNSDTQAFRDLLPCDPRVERIPYQAPYRELFARSDLLVTDYSSVAFDFAYLQKPVIYAQFDAQAFFGAESTHSNGYFDYRRDGFGEVEDTLEGTVDRIIEYMRRDCRMKEAYRKRVLAAFPFVDRDNCKRAYQALLKHDLRMNKQQI